jgi:hypothetical protein
MFWTNHTTSDEHYELSQMRRMQKEMSQWKKTARDRV